MFTEKVQSFSLPVLNWIYFYRNETSRAAMQ